MNQIELNQKTRDLLDRVRHKRKCLSLYDMPPDLAEAVGGPSHSGIQMVDSGQAHTHTWDSASQT